MADRKPARPHIIVLGNQKGGTGKSTTAMHLIASLLHRGFRVGAIDLDARQGTLTRYVQNRRAFVKRKGIVLPLPELVAVQASDASDRKAAEREESERLAETLGGLSACEFVVIDTAGNADHLSRLGHSYADTLITPMNDSFIDLDLLAEIDPETHKVIRPSQYSVMVWEQRKVRAVKDRGTIDWVVSRNRIASIASRNQKRIEGALAELARRIGFRLAPGFGERVIFRELFLNGLTLLDVKDSGEALTMSHVAARQEVRALLDAIGLKSPEAEAIPAARVPTEEPAFV